MIEETNKSKSNSIKPTRARRTTSKVGVKKENTTKNSINKINLQLWLKWIKHVPFTALT